MPKFIHRNTSAKLKMQLIILQETLNIEDQFFITIEFIRQ